MDPTSTENETEKERVELREVVRREIGQPGLFDAGLVQDVSQLTWSTEGRRRELYCLVTGHSQMSRDSESPPLLYNESGLEYFKALHRRHAVVTQITSDFCEATLSVHPVTGERIQPHRELSTNEKRRIHRALYRFELFRVLFTEPTNTEDYPKDEWYFTALEQSLLYLHCFRVWEIEELACVRDYMIRRYTEILQECSSELSKLYPNKDFDSRRCFSYSFYYGLPNHLYTLVT